MGTPEPHNSMGAAAGPDFVVIGAPKAGTTSVNRYLRHHPDVRMPPVKETNFFCFDFEAEGRPPRYVKVASPSEYFAYFEQQGGERPKVCGEVCPGYLAAPKAPELIKRYAPRAVLFCIFRDPAEVVRSAYGMRLRKGGPTESVPGFVDRVEAALREGRRERVSNIAQIAQSICYGSMLGRYLALFPSEQIRVLWYEDLDLDTSGVMRSLFQDIGVRPNVRIDYEVRANRGGMRWTPMVGPAGGSEK